jgi:MinD-like ATPase involved in chromosome partitioning or flagellar assembly
VTDIRPHETRPAGWDTEHIGVAKSEDQPVRSDGRRSLADRKAVKTDQPLTPKESEEPHQSNPLVLVGVLAFLAVVAIAAAAFVNPLYLAAVVPAVILATPYVAAHHKRSTGSAHQPQGLVPSRGVRAFFWKLLGSQLFAIFGWHWLQTPSLKDREHQALNSLWDMRKTQKIIAFVNSKGGSAKTAVCVWLACLLAYAIKRPPLAIDVNESPGHTASRLGIAREDTMRLREFLSACIAGRMGTFEEIVANTEWHRETGVPVIASEGVSIKSFTADQTMNAIKTAKRSNHSLFLDSGNVITAPGNWGAVAMADTLVFCGNVNMANSLEDISLTMERYTLLGHEQQVSEGIIVIVGAKLKERAAYAERYKFPVERTFVVPHNSYMASPKGLPVRLSKVPLGIRVILLEILVAIMAAPSVARQHIDLTKVHELQDQDEADTSDTDVQTPVPSELSTAAATA